jgi:hypothetical protein
MLKKLEMDESDHGKERCYCDHCVFCGKVRGAIRRGDKKEMRATMRDLLDRFEEQGRQMFMMKLSMEGMLRNQINDALDESTEEKADTIQ